MRVDCFAALAFAARAKHEAVGGFFAFACLNAHVDGVDQHHDAEGEGQEESAACQQGAKEEPEAGIGGDRRGRVCHGVYAEAQNENGTDDGDERVEPEDELEANRLAAMMIDEGGVVTFAPPHHQHDEQPCEREAHHSANGWDEVHEGGIGFVGLDVVGHVEPRREGREKKRTRGFKLGAVLYTFLLCVKKEGVICAF